MSNVYEHLKYNLREHNVWSEEIISTDVNKVEFKN